MSRLLLLLLALLMLATPDLLAEPAADNTALTLSPPKIHRPVYKRYRGNSRSKKRKRGLFKRWSARRKARRQPPKAAPARRGVIRVDAPDVQMPARPKP